MVLKFTNKNWVSTRSGELRPGNIVKVVKDDEITCDILLVSTNFDNGTCFVDTKNLDGETNLKEKICMKDFKSIKEDKIEAELNGVIDCDGANSNLNDWECNIENNGLKLDARMNQLLLKRCILKNT